MRRVFLNLAMAVFSLFAIIALFGVKTGTRSNAPVNDAAFRDGVYLGQRDAQSGSKPSPLKSRWSSESDRRSFAAGYFRGYMAAPASARWVPQPIDNKGFEEGRRDGISDRENSMSFDLQSKEKFRDPARGCADTQSDLNTCARQYREAYVIGYQHGYYAVDGRTARRNVSKSARPQNV